MTQLQLDLSEKANRKRVAPKLAARMIAMLAVRGGWCKRWEFQEVLGLKDRECRLGREASHGRILFSQRGYRLTKDASTSEVAECCSAILSQIKALQKGYRCLVIRAHKQLSGKNS